MRRLGLLLLLCVSLAACEKNDPAANREEETSANEQSVPDKAKDVHFLFFDASKGSKWLDLYVDQSLNGLEIEQIRLFQNDKAVSGYIDVAKGQYQNNKLNLTLLDYVSAFDAVELNLSAGSDPLRLPVGQFYLDRLEGVANEPESGSSYTLITGRSQTSERAYNAEATFSKGEAEGLRFRLPEQFDDTGYEKDLELIFEDSDRVEYLYGLRIPERYYLEHDAENIHVEILWTQQAVDGTESLVFQEYVPVDL